MMKNYKLQKLEKRDLNKSAKIAARAFYDYPMFKYILGEKHSEDNIKIILKFVIKYCILYGEAYTSSPEMEGIILFSDYNDYNFSLIRSLRSGVLSLLKLGVDTGKRFSDYKQLCQEIHNSCIKEPHQYIIMLCVDPEYQGQGYGKKLLLPVLKAVEKIGKPCYLETHSPENVVIYKKYGFKVFSEDKLPGTDIVHWSMIK